MFQGPRFYSQPAWALSLWEACVCCLNSWTQITKPYQQQLRNGSLGSEDSFIRKCKGVLLCCKRSPGPLAICRVDNWSTFLCENPTLIMSWIKVCIHGDRLPSSALPGTCSGSPCCAAAVKGASRWGCPPLLGCRVCPRLTSQRIQVFVF